MFQDLHQIIQTLTSKEFNSLEHFIKLDDSGRDLNYVSLFRCLYDMEDGYDDDLIDTFCEEHGTTKESLRVTSYELDKKIMLYLRDPKVRPDPAWAIECLLKDAGILERKGLFKLAQKKLDKALETARENNLPGLEYKVHITYSSYLLKLHGPRNLKPTIEQYEAALAAWKRHLASQEVIHLNHEAFHLRLQESHDITDLASNVNLEQEGIPEELSFFAQLRYAQTRNIITAITNDKSAGEKWQKAAMAIFDNEKLRENFPFEYIATFGNYQNALFETGSWKALLLTMQQLRAVAIEDPWLKMLRDTMLHLGQVNYWVNHPKILMQVSSEELDTVIDFLEEQAQQIPANKYYAIVVALATAFLLRGDHNLARQWWGKIKVGKSTEIRPRTQRLAIMMLLLNDYADPTFSSKTLSTRIDSTRKKVPKIAVIDAPREEEEQGPENANLPHEKIIIFYVRKLEKCPPRSREEKELLQAFQTELLDYQKNADEDGIATCNTTLEWLKLRLNGI